MIKALEHPMTLAVATTASVTSMLVAYNTVLTAVVVTCSAALALRKLWITFRGKGR
jgi:hypothetical protein